MNPDQTLIDAASRRHAGIAALRRLHSRIHQDQAQEREDVRRALIIGAVFVAAAALFAGWLFVRAGGLA